MTTRMLLVVLVVSETMTIQSKCFGCRCWRENVRDSVLSCIQVLFEILFVHEQIRRVWYGKYIVYLCIYVYMCAVCLFVSLSLCGCEWMFVWEAWMCACIRAYVRACMRTKWACRDLRHLRSSTERFDQVTECIVNAYIFYLYMSACAGLCGGHIDSSSTLLRAFVRGLRPQPRLLAGQLHYFDPNPDRSLGTLHIY